MLLKKSMLFVFCLNRLILKLSIKSFSELIKLMKSPQ
jgi:hypothetical protein